MSDYKLVPVEPTEEMLVAGQEEWAHRPHGALEDCEEARLIYKAMLAAAPAVQGEPVGWVNSDELDNMLDDRTATLFPVRTGFHGKPVYAAPQPAEQQPEVLAEGYFHPLPDESDYEFHDAEQFPDGSDCPACVPAVIVRKSAVTNQPAPDVAGLVEALEAMLEVRVVEADASYGLACAKAEHALAAHRKQGGEP